MNKIINLVIIISGVFFITNAVQAKIHSEVINYKIAGLAFQGYLSYDDEITGKRPGILVVHEWWGHNAYARKRADMLAELGYTAFAIDMYGKGKFAEHPDDAKKFMQTVLADNKVAESRFNEAKRILQNRPSVNSDQIAAIGYCFGGGTVLHMARQGIDLAGVVSFHGSLVTSSPAKTGIVKARILVLNGADDPFITAEQIAAFELELTNAGVDFEFVNYPKAKHSFTNPDADIVGKRFKMPLLYNKEADNDSWQRMIMFFQEIFHSKTTGAIPFSG